MMDRFDIPVVMFLFKRMDAPFRILKIIAQVQPQKLYLISDEGRNDEEKTLVHKLRSGIDKHITWDCEIIKNYAVENRGVYQNIGMGAKWVFEREAQAIFLEDDNLPEVTFFEYCRELLDCYRDDSRILWICGTDYLSRYHSPYGESYMFTQHLLPCGWASWSRKFLKYYDADLLLAEDDVLCGRLKYAYSNKALYRQQINSIYGELKRKKSNIPYRSWDYHMCLSIRANDLYGISPCDNQIKNIGADSYSEHSAALLNSIMTKRFCGMESHPIDFPLKHPKTVLPDYTYEKIIGNIILLPITYRIKAMLTRCLKFILRIPNDKPLFKR